MELLASSGRARDVSGDAAATRAAERDVRARDGWYLIRITQNPSRTGRTAQRSACAIVRDELQRLRRIVRGRTWLSHAPLQSLNMSPALLETIECSPLHRRQRPLEQRTAQRCRALARGALLAALAACGPRTHFPNLPALLPNGLAENDSSVLLARQLAPTLYLQRDESFPLERTVAVLNPTRRVIAYYLTYRHDLAARWSPFSQGPDEEEFWVGYDSTLAPTDLWTYWHGTILHADWRGKGQLGVDVQWGKHGSLPRGTNAGELPRGKSLQLFYAMTYAFPDLWLGRLSSRGPLCFCHSFARYQEFTRPVALGARLTAVGRTADPDSLLTVVFGRRYAHKPYWPWEQRRRRIEWRSMSGKRALLEISEE